MSCRSEVNTGKLVSWLMVRPSFWWSTLWAFLQSWCQVC